VIARVLVALVRGYQVWISPMLLPSCRFQPSCSAYAIEALQTHGAVFGSWLTLRRLLRCAPWHPGGVDLVPPPRKRADAARTRPAEDHSEEQAPC
jgi:uncharacterized protein